jgi:D-tyrosyl-tRNA(Tyr) deacylase
MRAVLQRVRRAVVAVDGETIGAIESGLLVLLGIAPADTIDDVRWLAEKTASLRIFNDEAGKMNLSVADVGGAVLVVSQFTLYGDCRKGRRPSFIDAAPPNVAVPLYETFVNALRSLGLPVRTGRFGAMMQVELVNDGPVTIIADSIPHNELRQADNQSAAKSGAVDLEALRAALAGLTPEERAKLLAALAK